MNEPGQGEHVGERRASTRFQIQAPAVAKVKGREIWAFTRDISTRAVYFRTAGEEQQPPVNEPLEFLIKIPPSMSYSKPCFIKGKGRTLRVDDLDGDETGMVVEIQEYEIESQRAHEDSGESSQSGL